ncbi:hypothetical protein HK101_004059 [Irineochytrium annulatum]|nr:hypothetical protein HK101_004059 [Irineochytrium annulatum]
MLFTSSAALGVLAALAGLLPGANAITQCSTTRPEWFSMSSGEQQAYLSAAQALMSRPSTHINSPSGLPSTSPASLSYEDFVYAHTKLATQVHGTVLFYPFHRLLVYMWEQAINSAGYGGPQPYWDWSLNSQQITASGVFVRGTIGTTGQPPSYCLSDSMFNKAGYNFAEIYSANVPAPTDGCLKRFPGGTVYDPNSVAQLLSQSTNFADFQSNTENTYHGQTHFSVGGSGQGHMADGSYSPADPLFFFHHAFMDKQWWRWQNQCPEYFNAYSSDLNTQLPWTGMTVQQALNLPICYTTDPQADMPLTNVCTGGNPNATATASTSATATAAPTANFMNELFLLMVPVQLHGVFKRDEYGNASNIPLTIPPLPSSTRAFMATATATPYAPAPAPTHHARFYPTDEPPVTGTVYLNGHELDIPEGYKLFYVGHVVAKVVPLDFYYDMKTGNSSMPGVKPMSIYPHEEVPEYVTPSHMEPAPPEHDPHPRKIHYPTEVPESYWKMMGMNHIHAKKLYNQVKAWIDECNNDESCVSPAARMYDDQNNMDRSYGGWANGTAPGVAPAQKKRCKAKKAKWFVQILGAAASDARPPSVIVHFDSQRYLFNVAEGIQRLSNDHKVRLNKIRSVLLTRLSWDVLGGFPGMLLTLADAGVRQLGVLGPAGTCHAVAAMRPFLFRPNLSFSVQELPSELPVYKDDNLTITPIPLIPISRSRNPSPTPPTATAIPVKRKSSDSGEDASALERAIVAAMFPSRPDATTTPDETKKAGKKRPRVNPDIVPSAPPPQVAQYHAEMIPDGTVRMRSDPLPARDRGEGEVLAYICKGPDVPGKVDAAKAISLGVKPGRDMGKLQRGESVTVEGGRVVEAKECVSGKREGAVFLIVDCPTKAHVQALVSNPRLSAKALPGIALIIHLASGGVIEDPAYRGWMIGFGEATRHVIAAAGMGPGGYPLHATAVVQHQLHVLDGDVFPLPRDCGPVSRAPDLPANFTIAESMLIHHMEPRPFLDTSEVRDATKAPTPSDDADKVAIAAYTECSKKVRATVEEHAAARRGPDSGSAMVVDRADEWGVDEGDVMVVPLGTGAAIPAKYRNVSSTLLLYPSGNVLLDAGEGTLGQIALHFGLKRAEEVIRDLGLLFVSHLHADHHLGVFGILKLRREPMPELTLLAPKRYITWLREYDAGCEDLGMEGVRMISCEEAATSGVSWTGCIGMKAVKSVRVNHCPGAFALVLEADSGPKVVFSGDCRPSNELVRAGDGADLLIHEATLEDEKMQEAKQKMHCTTSEAVDVGRRMRAKNLLLTHFSQRYPKFPKVELDANEKMTVGVAFDSMRIRLSEFWKLPLFFEPLGLLWGDQD